MSIEILPSEILGVIIRNLEYHDIFQVYKWSTNFYKFSQTYVIAYLNENFSSKIESNVNTTSLKELILLYQVTNREKINISKIYKSSNKHFCDQVIIPYLRNKFKLHSGSLTPDEILILHRIIYISGGIFGCKKESRHNT